VFILKKVFLITAFRRYARSCISKVHTANGMPCNWKE